MEETEYCVSRKPPRRKWRERNILATPLLHLPAAPPNKIAISVSLRRMVFPLLAPVVVVKTYHHCSHSMLPKSSLLSSILPFLELNQRETGRRNLLSLSLSTATLNSPTRTIFLLQSLRCSNNRLTNSVLSLHSLNLCSPNLLTAEARRKKNKRYCA